MLDKDTYAAWTAVFNEGGSTYEGDWSEGSVIKFLGPDVNDPSVVGGMVCRVAANRVNEFVSLTAIAEIVRGVEHDKSEAWNDYFENYTFEDAEGGTRLSIDIAVPDEFADMFNEMWPKALQRLKEIAERS